MKNAAILTLDFINDVVHEEGKFKGKGYADFVRNYSTIESANQAITSARESDWSVIHVKVGFSGTYKEQPKNSPLFGKAEEFQAIKLGTWATEFHDDLDVQPDDPVITKHRVSPFYGTSLELWLRNNKVSDLYLTGVATDLVVQSAARDAHDRGFNVFVLSDCCAAGSAEDHGNSLKTLAKIANVGTCNDLLKG